MNAFLLLGVLLVAWISSPAQQNPVPASSPCQRAESRQFDFWIGDWDLAWDKDGKGRNVIQSSLDGCAIIENFDGTPAMKLRGMSVSTFSRQLGKWQQTWVDNQSGYLDFIGEFKDGRMVLQRKATVDGKEIMQRMVWYNITKDKLDWNWERSDDEGKTWKVLWKIMYSRKK
ncbi:MAG TPA: hypothetical protein VJ742_10020 [Nitrososphaera sp.]|nr:hypothetical protein [Nitrososphaera sp.]